MQSVLIKATLSIKHLFIALMAVFKNAQLLLVWRMVRSTWWMHVLGLLPCHLRLIIATFVTLTFRLRMATSWYLCSGNGSIKIWDLRNAGFSSEVLRRLPHHAAFLLVVASAIYGSKWCNISSSVEGSSIYSWSADGSLRKYSTSVSTKMSTVTFVPPNDRFPIMSFDASRDGKFGLCCGGHNIRNNLHSKKASVYSRFHIICL